MRTKSTLPALLGAALFSLGLVGCGDEPGATSETQEQPAQYDPAPPPAQDPAGAPMDAPPGEAPAN